MDSAKKEAPPCSQNAKTTFLGFDSDGAFIWDHRDVWDRLGLTSLVCSISGRLSRSNWVSRLWHKVGKTKPRYALWTLFAIGIRFD